MKKPMLWGPCVTFLAAPVHPRFKGDTCMSEEYGPIPGNILFEAVRDKDVIIMANNVRIFPGVGRGIMRAARDLDCAVIFELARSECNQHVGYTGMTPEMYSNFLCEVAEDVGWDMWVLHADHIQVPKGTPEDVADIKDLIRAQIEAGYTSFAIDASYLFNMEGKTITEQLQKNIDVTTELAHFIEDQMGGVPFGLEVEVGEIGKEDEHGRVLTSPEEAVTYITALLANGLDPDILAIANGSAHGNIYDEAGNPIEQVSIDIDQTRAVAGALREAGLKVRIAQHGITGTPRDLIKTTFPRGDIIKGNVATFWQNLYWDEVKVYNPDLYKRAFDWTLENHNKPGKRPEEIFGKNGKYASKEFFDELYSMGRSFDKTVEAIAYGQARTFFESFNCVGTGTMVRKALD